MCDSRPQLPGSTAVLLLAEIKQAIEAFCEGDSNVFDTLRAIAVLLEPHRLQELEQVTRRAA